MYVCLCVFVPVDQERQSGAGAAGIRERNLASRPEIFLGYMKFYDLKKTHTTYLFDSTLGLGKYFIQSFEFQKLYKIIALS